MAKQENPQRHEGLITREQRWLRASAVLYLAGLTLHTADHVRRGVAVITTEVRLAGAISTVAGLAVVWLVLRHHRRAPIAAVIFSPLTVVGLTAAHLTPHWSSFSDAFPGARATGVSGFSWAVVLVEMAGGLALGLSGLAVIRQSSSREAAEAIEPGLRGE